MKSMASCLKTNKKLTNHSMRKTLVSKLKNSVQSRNVICEITGHAREASFDDYDEINENQRTELICIISGYKEVQNQNVQTRSPTKPVQMNPQIKRLQSNTNEPATGSDSSRPTRGPNSSGNDGLQSWFSAGWMFGISLKLSVAVPVPHGSLHFLWQPRSITELHWLHVQFLLQRRQ